MQVLSKQGAIDSGNRSEGTVLKMNCREENDTQSEKC